MADEPEQTEHAPTWMFPSKIARLPPEQQAGEWERTARVLHGKSKDLFRSKARWRAKAEAYAEALEAITEIAKNAHIVQ